jgi:NAD(P)-dependent dehydrogenase (short-subunit alcohol dehydrogenase family)
MKLQSKTALITGGNSGIGLATAQLFIAEGARVAITGRNQKTLDAAAKGLGPNAFAFNADVLDSKAREVLFATIKEKFGHLDIVFVNAGVGGPGSIAETSEAMFDEVLRTNLTGAFLTIQAALPLLRAGASIILNGSIGPIVGFPPGAGFYAASKGGLHAMSRSMAAELAPRGIRINVVSPGFIQTPIWERQPVPADVVTALTKRLLGNVPLDRWGRAEEVAKAVLFLASDDSSYVHGSEIIIDGGLTGTMLGGQAIKVEMDAARSGQRSGQG